MRPSKLKELQRLVEQLCWLERLSGTSSHRKALKVITSFLSEKGFKYRLEHFSCHKLIPVSGRLKANGKKLELLPFVGSPPVELKAELTTDLSAVKDKIALLPYGGKRDEEKAEELKRRGALAALSYLKSPGVPYAGTVGKTSFPFASGPRDELLALAGKTVELRIKSKEKEIKGTNVVVEFGRGPYLILLAHYDTKPFVCGAVDNCVSVALLLLLLEDLREFYELPMRVRAVFTDCEELGLEGARFHAGRSKNVLYAVNLDGLGGSHPAVIYRDYHGPNGPVVNEKFYRHLLETKTEIPFVESSTASSDHAPFKEKGVETLFLSSHPYPLRHTRLDDPHAVDWEAVKLWFELLAFFLRRLHRL
ncbi:MAG: M28 family peptidase [Aquificae bacterium]|nr:M28 family peptidase [Aquificota bacterium]